MNSGVALQLMLLAGILFFVDAKKCPADETKSLNDPNNLYDCPKDATCCFENGQPSCCTAKAMSDAVTDQMKLWGGLAAILLVIVIVVLTCRRDIEVCKEGTVCCPCCCKPKPHPDDDGQETPIISDGRARNMGPPDFTAPGTKPKPPPTVSNDHLHIYPPAGPAVPQRAQPMVAAPPLPPPPPKPRTAGFDALKDLDDDDEFRF